MKCKPTCRALIISLELKVRSLLHSPSLDLNREGDLIEDEREFVADSSWVKRQIEND